MGKSSRSKSQITAPCGPMTWRRYFKRNYHQAPNNGGPSNCAYHVWFMSGIHCTEDFFVKSWNKRPRAHNNEQRMGCIQSVCKPNPPETSLINLGLAPKFSACLIIAWNNPQNNNWWSLSNCFLKSFLRECSRSFVFINVWHVLFVRPNNWSVLSTFVEMEFPDFIERRLYCATLLGQDMSHGTTWAPTFRAPTFWKNILNASKKHVL